jgi:hypothetical protein
MRACVSGPRINCIGLFLFFISVSILYYFPTTCNVCTDTCALRWLLNHFWTQEAVSILKIKPPHGGFRSEAAVT